MIFVVTGSQKFQFNRLLEKIDDLAGKGIITGKVFAQTGYSNYRIKNYEFSDFLSRDDFEKKMHESSVVITHGGTGAIIGAVKKGKKVIAVPRLAKYKEHVDDHQVQLLKQFDEMNIICSCYDLDDLEIYLKTIEDRKFITYHSNTETIIRDIEDFLNSSL